MALQTLSVLFGILLISFGARSIGKSKQRQALLLACSYFVYAQWAGNGALLVLIASTLLNYACGSFLRRRPTTALLWIGLTLNVLLLGFFKYLLPVSGQWQGVSWQTDSLQQLIVPIGISFWTFQGLSYLFDLYREEEVDPSLLEFCLYMAFWPTVLSGPVCRLPKMLPQFRALPSSSVAEDFSIGAVRIVQGLFMKLVLAQLLATGLTADGGVNAGFDSVAPARSGLDVWALAIGYAFQIYFDFAGYSNIVIGAARLLGIRLQENFDNPYLSLTPSVFWTRWHMSLSFWIRDYVFLPLVTLRRNAWWPYAALVISMVVFGFWHGARFTYIAWGVYHGVLLLGHRLGQLLKRRVRLKLPLRIGALLSWASTFLLVSLGYIFFRANDLEQAFKMLRAIITPRSYAFVHATLPQGYYFLVALVVVGYFAYVGIEQLLALWKSAYRDRLLENVRITSFEIVSGWGFFRTTMVATVSVLTNYKWWWLTPALMVLLIVTTLSFFGQSSNIAPFIYTLF